MRAKNPFVPGFNQNPPELAGRDGELSAITEALTIADLDGRTPRPIVLVGGRGVGKTVLLRRARELAANKHSWLSVHGEAHPNDSVLPHLVDRLNQAAHLYRQTPDDRQGRWALASTTVKAVVAGSGLEAKFDRMPAAPTDRPAPTFLDALTETLIAAADRGAGLLLTLDEMHLAPRDDVARIAAALQEITGSDLPLAVVLAGLPSLHDPRRKVTYLERGEWHNVDLLSPTDAAVALTAPSAASGRPMAPDAADELVTDSGGYPYAIQLLGHHAWRQSSDSDSIDVRAARAAIARAERELGTGLYASRWYDASPKERTYLAALAELLAANPDAHVDGASLARQLSQQPQQLSYLRQRLLAKGTIFAGISGLRFATPGMARWINENA